MNRLLGATKIIVPYTTLFHLKNYLAKLKFPSNNITKEHTTRGFYRTLYHAFSPICLQ